jgi:peptidoglycan/LPS O-acetylase OafA/YrhL
MHHGASPQTTLHGPQLLAARLAWITATVLVVGVYAAAVPVAFATYRDVCESGATCGPYWYLTSKDAMALRGMGLSVGFYAAYSIAVEVFYGLVFWVIGALIFWRKSDNWVALLVSFMLVTFGAMNLIELPSETSPSSGVPGAILVFFGFISFVVAIYLFPDGRFVPRWTRWLVIIWIWYVGTFFVLSDDSPLNPGAWPAVLHVPLAIGLLGTMVFAQVYRYRQVSQQFERQQTKWVVFGLTVAVAGFILVALPAAIFPEELLQPGTPKVLYALVELTVTNIFFLLIPLSIGVAILRHHLWDIDIIINRTLVYGSLTVTLALVYFGGVTTTEAIFRALTGQEQQSQLAIVVSTLVIAALFTPLRRRIQSFIDRSFYRKKYDTRKTLETFSAQLRDETDLEALRGDLVGVVRETMQPVHVSLWLRSETTSKGEQRG